MHNFSCLMDWPATIFAKLQQHFANIAKSVRNRAGIQVSKSGHGEFYDQNGEEEEGIDLNLLAFQRGSSGTQHEKSLTRKKRRPASTEGTAVSAMPGEVGRERAVSGVNNCTIHFPFRHREKDSEGGGLAWHWELLLLRRQNAG